MLRQHDRSDISVVGAHHQEDCALAPGSPVCHVDYRRSSYGIVIAVDATQATVLWSREPPEDLRASQFQALAAPLARRVNYADVARKMIQVEPLPPGAMPFYAKDDKEDV